MRMSEISLSLAVLKASHSTLPKSLSRLTFGWGGRCSTDQTEHQTSTSATQSRLDGKACPLDKPMPMPCKTANKNQRQQLQQQPIQLLVTQAGLPSGGLAGAPNAEAPTTAETTTATPTTTVDSIKPLVTHAGLHSGGLPTLHSC